METLTYTDTSDRFYNTNTDHTGHGTHDTYVDRGYPAGYDVDDFTGYVDFARLHDFAEHNKHIDLTEYQPSAIAAHRALEEAIAAGRLAYEQAGELFLKFMNDLKEHVSQMVLEDFMGLHNDRADAAVSLIEARVANLAAKTAYTTAMTNAMKAETARHNAETARHHAETAAIAARFISHS